MYDDVFMRRAIELSRRALAEPGTEPFGAVVVKDGQIVGEGFNHAKAHHDPTSHGEVEAIKDACRRLATVDLSGCELYSSCEPCAMCVAVMAVTGIAKLYYAASLEASGKLLGGLPASKRPPIDAEAVRAAAASTITSPNLTVEQHSAAAALEVIALWAKAG